MWSCSLDRLLPGLWPPHPSAVACWNTQKRTKPSADAWAIDPRVRVVPSFLRASLFQSVCVKRRWWCVSCGSMNFFFEFFTSCRMPLLGAFSCRPIVSTEASAARMPSLILWMSPTGYCCREKQNSLVVLEYTSSRVWFLYGNYYKMEITSAVSWRISSKLIFASCVGYFDLVWSRTRMRGGILYYFYLLGCVLIRSTSTHMISYVRTWGLLRLIFHWNSSFS